MHDALAARLQELGRETWLREACARMVSNAERDAGDRWPHLSLRAAQFLDRPAPMRLLRLLRWREAPARRKSEERRAGKEGVRTCAFQRYRYHLKKKIINSHKNTCRL